MAEKELLSRIVNKHDTEENWAASNLIPKQGEIIIYDIDFSHDRERIKIGDGINKVSALPFVAADYSAGSGITVTNSVISHSNSIEAGTAKGSEDKTLLFGGTFTIPTISYDAQGHITGKGVTTMTMPKVPNNDTKVTNTLATTTKAYVTGTTSATTNTGTQIFDDNIYIDTVVGQLVAKVFKGALAGNAATATALTSSAGSETKPIYFKEGKPVALSYSIESSVPAGAKFTDTTYVAATAEAAGLMSAADKTKLDGIAAQANKTIVDSALNGSSTNPVQNKIINAAITNLTNSLNTFTAKKGAANGLAELDANGKVPTSQLPSYVDDVLEYAAKANFPTTGETGKIYVDAATNKTYRWSGSAYVEISASLALGTTSSTAFRGDYGNTAYTHATAKGIALSSGLYKITTNAQGHVTAAAAVAKADITALGIPGSNTTYAAMKGATTSAAGTSGLTPAPAAGAANRYLRSDGTWAVPPDTNTIYGNMGAATASAAGKAGLVPAPGAGKQGSFLRGDGTWQTPTVASAPKWTTARTLSWTGDASGSMSVDGSVNKSATLTLANSGVTAGTYGPTANATPGYGATFTVPSITVDAKGRVTSAASRTVKIPAQSSEIYVGSTAPTGSQVLWIDTSA